MGFLDKMFTDSIFKSLKENSTQIENIIENNCEEKDIEQEVADNYFCLIKQLHRSGKPDVVVLSADDYYSVIVDDVTYDLDDAFSHNDVKNTERKMEIESLIADGADVGSVAKLLNDKIKYEW